MRVPSRWFHLLVLLCGLTAALGLSGLGAELAEAVPRGGADFCADDCEDGELPGCGVDGTCLCACCPPPAFPPGAPAPVITQAPIIVLAAAPSLCPQRAGTPPYHPPK